MASTMQRDSSASTISTTSSPPSTSSGRSRAPSSSAPMSPAISIWSPNGTRRRTARLFRSTKIDPEVYRARTPWYHTPVGKSTLRRTRWTCLGVTTIGLLSAAALIVTAILAIPKHNYCLVFEDEFNGDSIDSSIWSHEVQLGGFGNDEFEMTTASPNNSFVEDGQLYIVPTLSNETYGNDAIINGYTLNFTADGTCTGTSVSDCVAASNSTVGNYSVIPPVMSARLTTRNSHSIRYGKVEVKVRMPTGDWLWPAVWMLPRDNVYGQWPLSGEIDIVETKGNLPKNEWDENSNVVKAALHWGLDSFSDMYTKTVGWRTLKRGYANEQYYTYGMNWDPKGIRMWQSKPSRVMKEVKFNEPFWNRGSLGDVTVNATVASNPWITSNNTNAAPFDQDFYLILSLAAGGTNGWFEDGSTKPWANGSPHPAWDFWAGRSSWLPSWPTDPKKRGMAVESVRMWRIAEPGEKCAA